MMKKGAMSNKYRFVCTVPTLNHFTVNAGLVSSDSDYTSALLSFDWENSTDCTSVIDRIYLTGRHWRFIQSNFRVKN